LFEDDVDVAVEFGAGGIGGPPDVDPITVDLNCRTVSSVWNVAVVREMWSKETYLMIRQQKHPLRKIALNSSVWQLTNLMFYAGVTAQVHSSWAPPLRHGQD